MINKNNITEWNETYPPGTPVWYLTSDDKTIRTETVGRAIMIGRNERIGVKCENGLVQLGQVAPRPCYVVVRAFTETFLSREKMTDYDLACIAAQKVGGIVSTLSHMWRKYRVCPQ